MAETGIFVKDKTMVDFAALQNREQTLAVVGLGYVGLPLAVAFSRHMNVLGFDINAGRIEELRKGHDRTNEVTDEALAAATIKYTCDPADLARAAVIIVAVPTPIDEHRSPDLTPVVGASHTVGRHMPKGCVVVYESTVYPGLTEEICVPILEQESGLTYGTDFTVGYSPERINPGDKVHTLETIKKIVSGSDQATADLLAQVYGSVVKAGIHRASSIKVAEAAKVIENTQRDLNIALMNELAIIFERLGIDTLEVLEAAGTKWNFLPFRPGLVGGHCIGVDPYYLTFKAEEMGFHPEVILAGRRTNDNMGKYVAECLVKRLIKNGNVVSGARVGILGFTFKENVPDLRNTRVVDVIRELKEYNVVPLVHDAEADPAEAMREYGQELVDLDQLRDLDAVLLAVSHKAYAALTPEDIKARCKDGNKAVLHGREGLLRPADHARRGHRLLETVSAVLLVCAATARELLSALPEQALGPAPGAACGPAAQTRPAGAGIAAPAPGPAGPGLHHRRGARQRRPRHGAGTGRGPTGRTCGLAGAQRGRGRQHGPATGAPPFALAGGGRDLAGIRACTTGRLWTARRSVFPSGKGRTAGLRPSAPGRSRAAARLPARAALPARGHVPERSGRQRFPAACGTAPAGPSRGPAGKYGRFCRGAGLRPPGHRLCGGTQRFQPGGAARTA